MKNFSLMILSIFFFSTLSACLGTEVGNGNKVPSAENNNKNKVNESPDNMGSPSSPILNSPYDLSYIRSVIFAPCKGIIEKSPAIEFDLDSLVLNETGGEYDLKYKGSLVGTARFEGSDDVLTAYDAKDVKLTHTAQCSAISEIIGGISTEKKVSITHSSSSRSDLTWTVNSTQTVIKIKIEQFDTSKIPEKRNQDLVFD